MWKKMLASLGITGGLGIVVLGITFFPILGAVFGSWAGWAVGIVFDETFEAMLRRFNLAEFSPWQIGATLGFVGGFFKRPRQKNKN